MSNVKLPPVTLPSFTATLPSLILTVPLWAPVGLVPSHITLLLATSTDIVLPEVAATSAFFDTSAFSPSEFLQDVTDPISKIVTNIISVFVNLFIVDLLF